MTSGYHGQVLETDSDPNQKIVGLVQTCSNLFTVINCSTASILWPTYDRTSRFPLTNSDVGVDADGHVGQESKVFS